MPEAARIRAALALTALLAAAIGWVTLQPLPFAGPPGGDKLHHVLAFFALVFPAVALQPRWALPLFVLAVAYGGLIEIVQPHVGRSGDLGDWAADALGAALGTLAGLALTRVPRR